MTKSEWISHKIQILEHENKGRSHAQNVAIAYSMWEQGSKKQEGGDINNPIQEDYFKKLQTLLSNYTPALRPMPIAQEGFQYNYEKTGNTPITSAQAKQINNSTGIQFTPEFAQAYFSTNTVPASSTPPVDYTKLPIRDITSDGQFTNRKVWRTQRPEWFVGKKQQPVEGVDYTVIPYKQWEAYQNSPEYKTYMGVSTTGNMVVDEPMYQQGGELPIAQQGLWNQNYRPTAPMDIALSNNFGLPLTNPSPFIKSYPTQGGMFLNNLSYGQVPNYNFNQPTTNFVATTPPATLTMQTPKQPTTSVQPTPKVKNSTTSVATPPTTASATQQRTPLAPIESFLKPTGVTYGTTEEQLQKSGDTGLKSLQSTHDNINNTSNNDWIKYNILNPYAQGMDLNTSLAYTGQQFGQGHIGMGIAGAGLSALKGVRSFLSGYASGKGQKTLEQQMYDKLYNSDENLYQQGGGIHIKESHEGLFTEQAHKAGYDNVQAFAHHVMSNKDNYDPTTVQRANFAINFGGSQQKQQGGNIEVPKYKSAPNSYYQEGGEYELSDEEIQDLLSKGYKLE